MPVPFAPREAEAEIGAALTGYFEDEGISVVSGIAYRAIRKIENGIALDGAMARTRPSRPIR